MHFSYLYYLIVYDLMCHVPFFCVSFNSLYFFVGVHPCCWRDLASRTLFLLCEFLTFKNATTCHLIMVPKISVSVSHLRLFKVPIIDLCVQFTFRSVQGANNQSLCFHVKELSEESH